MSKSIHDRGAQLHVTRQLQLALVRVLAALLNRVVRSARHVLWHGRLPLDAREVCIYRIGQVGDTVCAIPAMYGIRKAYPKAHLTLLTSSVQRNLPNATEVLEGVDWIDEIICYYQDEIDSWPKRFAFLKSLRRRAFDVWIELPQEGDGLLRSLRNMLFARLAGAKWGGGWKINVVRLAIQAQAESMTFPNEVQRLLGLVETMGLRVGEPEFPVAATPDERSRVDLLLRKSGILGKGVVGLAPGAKRSTNRWPAEGFIAVGRYLAARGAKVVVIGGPGDRELGDAVASGIGPGAVNLAGATQLRDSWELLRRCDFLICNDSGVQHLAAASGVPCVSIFSRRDMPGKWSPYGPRNHVLQKHVKCHTCYLEVCPHDNLCVRMITPEEVIAVAEQELLNIDQSDRSEIAIRKAQGA